MDASSGLLINNYCVLLIFGFNIYLYVPYTQGPTPTRGLGWMGGCSVDHTLGTSSGHHAYTEATHPPVSSLNNYHYELLLPSEATIVCVEYWYHMFGLDSGTFSMYQRVLGGNPTFPHASISGPQGDTWHTQTLQFDTSLGFLVRFSPPDQEC